jgi:phage gpG-like protein
MITVTVDNALQLSLYLKSLSTKIHDALVRVMTYIGIDLQRYIVRQKLEGQVLHHRTGKLIRSVNQRVIDAYNVVAAVVTSAGSGAPYGFLHEFGGTVRIPEHTAHNARRSWIVRAHDATFPVRSYARTSLADRRADYLARIQAAIAGAL